MPYESEISRDQPSAVLFLVDQSESMSDPWGGAAQAGMAAGSSMAEQVADVLNRFLGTLILTCTKDEGVRNYFDVGLIGYGATVGSAWRGVLESQEMWPISEVADRPLRIEERVKKVPDGAGGLIETSLRLPLWVEPVADGPTPMCEALARAKDLLASWITDHPDSFPPIVLNITDGEATDGDPVPISEEVREVATKDGNVLLFNVHLSTSFGEKVSFPRTMELLTDPFANSLYQMSSNLTPKMVQAARAAGYKVGARARGMAFQSDLDSLIEFLNIGTRTPALK